MTRQWLPKKNEFVILDTNIVIHLRQRNDYRAQCTGVIDRIIANGAKLIIPQIVECELIRNARDIKEFDDTLKFIKQFIRWKTTSEVIDTACRIQALYCWNDGTKNHGQKDIFNDMIVGATAGHQEIQTKKKTYILSCNQDFLSPYFEECHRYAMRSTDGMRSSYLHYYRPKKNITRRDWRHYQASLIPSVT